MPRPENRELYKKYKTLADATPGVHFVGRLATYKYYNMDQVTGQALSVINKLRQGEPAVELPSPRSMVYPNVVTVGVSSRSNGGATTVEKVA